MPFRTAEGWWSTFETRGALWIHNGDPKKPHAVLTGGMHTDRVFNSRQILSDELLMHQAATDLFSQFVECVGEVKVEGVVGPQTGATLLAELLSYQIKVRAQRECFWVSPAKGKGREKLMIFSDDERTLLANQSILLCEDVITTGGSANRTADAVSGAGGIVLPFVLGLLNRSDLTEVGGKRIIALINRDMPTWTRKKCLLCEQGSRAIRPKDNWERLNA